MATGWIGIFYLANSRETFSYRTMQDVDSEAEYGSEFADDLLALAERNWVGHGKRHMPNFNAKLVDQIFAGLTERSFPLRALLVLDQTLYLEKYVQ